MRIVEVVDSEPTSASCLSEDSIMSDGMDKFPEPEKPDLSRIADSEFKSPASGSNLPADFLPPPVEKSKPVKQSFLAKTALDLDACRQVMTKMVSEKAVKVISKPGVFKPEQPIQEYNLATPCSENWEGMSGTNRFRVCSGCNLNVYDFSGMELAEAQALVFKREGRPDCSLYRRKDGRFLVADCPVGVKRGRVMLALIATAAVVTVGLIALAVMMPPPPKPAVVESPYAPVKTPATTAKSGAAVQPAAAPTTANQTAPKAQYVPMTEAPPAAGGDYQYPKMFVPGTVQNTADGASPRGLLLEPSGTTNASGSVGASSNNNSSYPAGTNNAIADPQAATGVENQP